MLEIPSQNNQQQHRYRYKRWFFNLIAGMVACVGVITLGMWTYGVPQPIHITKHASASDDTYQEVATRTVRGNTISWTLPKLPSEDYMHEMLNATIPQVCDGCKEDALTCLHRYIIDQRVLRGPNYDYLVIDFKTGHIDRLRTYSIILDLRNDYAVIERGGRIKKTACRDIFEENTLDGDVDFIQVGIDAILSHYLDVP